MEQANKQITSEAGGKLQPAQGLDSGLPLDRKPRKLKVVDVPEAGLVVSPPDMAKAIIESKKTLLVKSKPFDIGEQQYVLLSLRKALGVVELGARKEINAEEFAELEKQHLITEELREQWCEAQASWCEGPWYAWPVKVLQKFDQPRDTNVKTGPQVVVHDVQVEGAGEEKVSKAIWGSPAGKTKIAKRIVSMLHDHTTYVEPFAGSGAVLFEKEPSKTEVLNDADPEIAEAFKTLKGITEDQIEKLEQKDWKSSSKTYFALAKASFKSAVDKLYRFLYMSKFSFGRKRHSYAKDTEGKSTGIVKRVAEMAPRLKNVQVYCSDYEEVVKQFDGKNTTFYFDPPYAGYDAMVGEKKFNEEHFLEVLQALKGKFLFTYGVRGKLAGLLKDTDFKVKRIRPARDISVLPGPGRGRGKPLTQLVVTNYEPVKKAELDDGWVVEEWTRAMEEAAKIEDVDTYDPAEANDAQLRDDFRILLAWYASWKADPEGFEHDLETIEKLLRKVLKELVRRGPEVIQFNPRGMKASVREFFQQVARDVKVPETMFKRLQLSPETDPEELTAQEQLLAHWMLHELFAKESGPGRGAPGWSTEDIVNLHAKIVDRMGKHPPPPDNGLDELSADFETGAEKRPKWYEQPVAKRGKLATINRSGEERGPEITLSEVLPHFKDFKIRTPLICLVGGLANHGKTKGDIDILANLDEDTPDWLKEIIEFRLGRSLPGELAERMEVHFDRSRGPFTNFVELFDLRAERVNLQNEIKEMRAPVQKQEPRAAPAKLQAQANRAAKADKLTVGEFFYQPKPTRPAYPEQLQTVKQLLSLFEEHAEEWLPTVAQKKYDGGNHQIHKDGEKVRIISEDGDDNTDRLPGVVAAVKALKDKKLVLPAEIEMWDGSQHLPREAVAGYINSKDPADDSSLVANIYDVLHTDEGDIHGKTTDERLKALDGLGIKQSTMGAPDLKQRLNKAPSIKVDDLEELERVTERLRKLPGSEGAVFKQAGAPYPLKKATLDTWVKFHNATTIRGLVTGREKTKGGVWVYQYAVLPGKENPKETVEVQGKKVVQVGDTFSTKREFSAGDHILVEAETVNLERSPEGVRMTAWVPRVIGEYTGKPDTVDTTTARAKTNLVLQVKEIDEEGNVEYQTTKLQKQADPYLEIPPETKKYKYSVQHHWRGKGVHADLRMVLRPGELLLGWTMNTQIKGVVKEPVTTLSEAQRWSTKEGLDKVSKINWQTGEWATRSKAGTDKLVRTEILSERKAPEPYAWLEVEGKTKDPESGKAPPVGGTREFPGVFDIVDQGSVEYGAQKPWFHEYYFQGGGLNYRMFFRLLKISKRAESSDCEACGSEEGEIDMGWEEAQPAVFCKRCSTEFLTKAQVVLPPSEEQEMPEGAVWLAIYPDDQQPYVLDSDAVKKGWMPPDKYSALPAAIRSQVPAEFRYWKKRGAAAKALRDELVAAIGEGKVKLDYAAPYSTRKASLLDADFVLQEQTWKGPIQVRIGPTRTRWWVRLDIGRRELLVLDLQRNPLDNETVTARVEHDRHKDSMELSGAIAPGHYLNPTKETPSNIEPLDQGKAEVLAITKDFIKIRFKGKKLKGLYGVKRNNAEWLWSPTEEGPTTKLTAKSSKFELTIPFDRVWVQKGKDGTEKRLVTGIVLEPDEVDAQNDWEREEVIERAAHNFLRNYNLPPEEGGTRLGYMHKQFGDIGIDLVESSIAHAEYKLGGTGKSKTVKKGSWVMTVHVRDDTKWEKVKSGEITGFSVGGVATVASK